MANAESQVKTTINENEEEMDPWALESGLLNDEDGYLMNCTFGTKADYASQITVEEEDQSEGVKGLMFMADIVNTNFEKIGNVGFSVGTGWTPVDGGAKIVHIKRKNVVDSTRYGQFQRRVIGDLQVKMRDYGLPTMAKAWEGLGFHWMQEDHETLKKDDSGNAVKKSGIMPTQFLGVNEAIRTGKATMKGATSINDATTVSEQPAKKSASAGKTTGAKKVKPEVEAKLKELAQTIPYVKFAQQALQVEGATDDDKFMSHLLDGSQNGFWALANKKA